MYNVAILNGRTAGIVLQKKHAPWLIIVSVLALVFALDSDNISTIISSALSSLGSTLKFILLATLLLAYLKSSGSESLVGKAFQGREVRMIFIASLFGGLSPFCSCEVIPFVAGMLALGVPLAPIMAFWLSSPLIDPATLLITYSVLGMPFAIGKTLSAVTLGLFGGFAVKYLVDWKLLPVNIKTPASSCGTGCGTPANATLKWKMWQDAGRRTIFKSEFSDNFMFLLKWLALAYTLEALMLSYIPAEMIARVVGGEGIVPITIAAVVGMPTYLNGFVATPLIATLIEQGMQNGAAMAFLVAGPVTSIPAMVAVWSLVRWQVFSAYIALAFIGAIVAGVLFQYIVA